MFPFLWCLIIMGWYVFYRIIGHIKSKAFGTQTLLDVLYIQLLQNWVFEGVFQAALFTLVEQNHTSLVSSWIVGWGAYAMVVLSSIHVVFCLLSRIALIFASDYMDRFEDCKILWFTR